MGWNLYILHPGAAFGRARFELPSLVRRLRAQMVEEEEEEEHRMRDGHCWHMADVEVLDVTHSGPAMAGKAEEESQESQHRVEEENQESQDPVEEEE